jgi:class 3 adenylate cyclase
MSETEASYEVCILVGSRWEIHARYPVTGAAMAIEEAKQLEQTTKSAVKVMREVYDKETGLYKQVTVYKGAHAPAPKTDSSAAKARRYRAAAGRSGYTKDDDDLDGLLWEEDGTEAPSGTAKRRRSFVEFLTYKARPVPRNPKQVTVAGLLARIAAFIVISLSVAAMVTVLMPSLAPALATRNITLVGHGEASVLFVTFVASFLLTFAFLAAIVLSGVQVVRPRRIRAQAPTGPRRPKRLSGLPAPDYSLLQQSPDLSLEPPAPSPEPEPAPPLEWPSQAALPPEPEENLLDEVTEDPEVAEAQLSPAGQQQKLRMMTFLAGAIDAVKSSGAIDPFSRFGINLYVAGAVGALATTQAIDDADARIILAEGAVTLGTPWEMARKFAENADSYLMQPRYLEMYEAGRRSMLAFLEGDEDGPRQLTGALDAWRNPAKREEQTGPLAVMFTDIVGSTNMTVTLGDDAAQYVVRTHNRIVRSALANYSGREIKHTGDGIMASFATVSNAVEAAVEMLRRVAANNAAEGDIPLHLRIGINAGEPVIEDDDLFGVTVQLSARLCTAAEADQIVVSEVVRSLCSGKEVAFRPLGVREMKGFKDPIPLYEAVWRREGAPA